MNRITHSLAALLLIAGLAGCSEEETLSGTPGDTRTPITITVTDGGYTPDDAARQSTAGSDIRQNADNRPSTRAVDNGYVTTFTAGDKIGLYAVVDDAVVSSNIPLTHNGTGWTGEAYYEGAKAKYFAYYPYQSTLTGTLDASATDASAFFANVISAWTPATDQGTHAAYTASDLMTGSGTASKQSGSTYSLELTMTHAMALVVIETPMTKYTLTTDANYTWTAAAAHDTRFYGFTPYNPSPGTYRYLVKPGQTTAADLMGSYTGTLADGSTATKEYAVSPNGITTANYALYKVDGGITSKTHTLQVGDFYMNDGSLVAHDATLTDAQKEACIGIIYSTSASRIGDAAKKALTQKGVTIPHGLVMALTNASEKCRWGETYRNENNGTGPFQNNTNTLQVQYNNVDGYGETHWILNTYDGATLQNTYTAFYHASRYGVDSGTAKYAAPANITTGWFIPSMGQWWDILSNLGGIDLTTYRGSGNNNASISGAAKTAVDNMNRYLEKIDSATKFSTGTHFWSSSEFDSLFGCNVLFFIDKLELRGNAKGDSGRKVRCVFAF
ncbi:fimbrillin family protein [Bacteroides timonensis]|uniref:fimbrillin family protein n=1 Tax=Bacteroides timonensis TaxID=1470345 RepID=UPI0004B117DB|nr:fimbrillin family protein [Bacteroides timonensis]